MKKIATSLFLACASTALQAAETKPLDLKLIDSPPGVGQPDTCIDTAGKAINVFAKQNGQEVEAVRSFFSLLFQMTAGEDSDRQKVVAVLNTATMSAGAAYLGAGCIIDGNKQPLPLLPNNYDI